MLTMQNTLKRFTWNNIVQIKFYYFAFGVKAFGIIETFSIAFLRGTANVKLQFRVSRFPSKLRHFSKAFLFKTCSGILGNKHGGSKKVLFLYCSLEDS